MSAGLLTFPDGAGYVPGIRYGAIQFACNAGANPVLSAVLGSLKGRVTSIVYAATGKWTVTMMKGFVFPKLPIIKPTASCADATLTNQFSCFLVGTPTQVSGVLSFVIQAVQGTTAFQPPATAGNNITISFEGVDETAV